MICQIIFTFLEKYGKDKFLVFGFTSLIYENLIQKLSINLIETNFQNGILIHGGGWKKMKKLKNQKILKMKKSKTILFSSIQLFEVGLFPNPTF